VPYCIVCGALLQKLLFVGLFCKKGVFLRFVHKHTHKHSHTHSHTHTSPLKARLHLQKSPVITGLFCDRYSSTLFTYEYHSESYASFAKEPRNNRALSRQILLYSHINKVIICHSFTTDIFCIKVGLSISRINADSHMNASGLI